MVERERVSALMDGELDSDQGPGFERVLKDEAAAECWRDYHLIGDVMRGEAALSGAFAARVSTALAAEPTVLAPPRSRSVGTARARTFALSAAASAAGLAVVVWLAMQGISGPSTAPLASGTQAVQPSAVASSDGQEGAKALSEVSEYVAAHQEYSPTAAMPGVASYVRTDYAR